MMMGASLPAIIRAGGRSSTGLQPLAWVSPTPLGVLRGQPPGAKGNSRAQRYETEMLFLIGKVTTKCSVSDGHGLNGRSSTRGGRCKTPTRSPSSSEPGRRPQPRGWRANETHRTTGGRRHGQQDRESLNGPTQRLTCVSPTSRRCVPWDPLLHHAAAYPIHASVPPIGGLAVSPGSGVHDMGTASRHPNTNHRFEPWPRASGEGAACAAMGYPMCLSGYLDPYPVLFHGVSVSQ